MNNLINASPENQGQVFGEVVMEGIITGGVSKALKFSKASRVRPKRSKGCDCKCGSLNCFGAGTVVETEDGPRPIEEIEVGDKVWAYDEETGERQLAEVVRVFARTTVEVWTVEVDGEVIETTAEHPFYIADKGWIEARELQRGDQLVTLDHIQQSIGRVEREERTLQVYNFEVRGLSTYFVGDARVLVHNCTKTRAVGKEVVGKAIGVDKIDDLIQKGDNQRRVWRASDPKAFDYEPNPKHGPVRRRQANPEPKDPLGTLQDRSVWLNPETTTRRIGVDTTKLFPTDTSLRRCIWLKVAAILRQPLCGMSAYRRRISSLTHGALGLARAWKPTGSRRLGR